ncbi:hypothetical protein SFUMM280S_09658 [Streptomyces fumanus]
MVAPVPAVLSTTRVIDARRSVFHVKRVSRPSGVVTFVIRCEVSYSKTVVLPSVSVNVFRSLPDQV